MTVAGLDVEGDDAAILDGDLQVFERVLPVFRSVSIAFLIASLVRSADINAVDALSTRLVMRSSRMVALPVAQPAAERRLALHAPGPGEHFDLVLVLLSCDSPTIAP